MGPLLWRGDTAIPHAVHGMRVSRRVPLILLSLWGPYVPLVPDLTPSL